MEFTRIILRPVHTEKTYTFASYVCKKYAFEVDIKATKHDIAIAFESIYGIHPVKIATQIRKPAQVRTGTAKPGYSKLTKLAYVTLPQGADIAASNTEAPKETSSKKTTTKKDVTKKEITKKEVTKTETKTVAPEVVKETYKELEKAAGLPDDSKDAKAEAKKVPTTEVVKETYKELEKVAGLPDDGKGGK